MVCTDCGESVGGGSHALLAPPSNELHGDSDRSIDFFLNLFYLLLFFQHFEQFDKLIQSVIQIYF